MNRITRLIFLYLYSHSPNATQNDLVCMYRTGFRAGESTARSEFISIMNKKENAPNGKVSGV